MKLLIIGGTEFVGRHLAEAALGRGHAVTLFHRGRHGSDLFPDAEHVLGDRDGGLEPLAGRTWDAVIDTCGYVPRVVGLSALFLAPLVERYVFVSTVSVYRDFVTPGIDESYPVGALDDGTVEEVTGDTYGPLKVLCEQAVEAACPGRALIVRPGLVVGPHDKTGRFTYWPRRVAEGGRLLAPGRPERRVQFIDARDLAEWTIRLTERRAVGVFNAVSDDPTWTMGRLLDECRDAVGAGSEFIWTDDGRLLAAGVQPWTDLPLWLPATEQYAGMDSISAARAVSEGLTFRSLRRTVEDTLAWDRSLAEGDRAAAGVTRERERDLLRDLAENLTAP